LPTFNGTAWRPYWKQLFEKSDFGDQPPELAAHHHAT
jgi:hypothetical protein